MFLSSIMPGFFFFNSQPSDKCLLMLHSHLKDFRLRGKSSLHGVFTICTGKYMAWLPDIYYDCVM